MIEIEFDQRDIRRVHRNLALIAGRNLMGAMGSAAEDAAVEVREVFADEMAKRINAPRSDFADRISRGNPVAASRTLVSLSVVVSPRHISLRTFGLVQTAAGVVYHPYTSSKAKVLRSAFGPDIPRLNRHAFAREGRRRLPIKKIPGMNLRKDPVAQQAADATSAKMPDILARHMARHVQLLVDHRWGRKRGYTGWNRRLAAGRDDRAERFGKMVQS